MNNTMQQYRHRRSGLTSCQIVEVIVKNGRILCSDDKRRNEIIRQSERLNMQKPNVITMAGYELECSSTQTAGKIAKQQGRSYERPRK